MHSGMTNVLIALCKVNCLCCCIFPLILALIVFFFWVLCQVSCCDGSVSLRRIWTADIFIDGYLNNTWFIGTDIKNYFKVSVKLALFTFSLHVFGFHYVTFFRFTLKIRCLMGVNGLQMAMAFAFASAFISSIFLSLSSRHLRLSLRLPKVQRFCPWLPSHPSPRFF